MAKIDIELLDMLGVQITSLPQRTTSYELVKRLAPVIAEARERGQDLNAIAKLLKGMDIHISPSTIKSYLSRARREARRTVLAETHKKDLPTSSARAPEPNDVPTPLEKAPVRGVPRATATPTGGRFEFIEDKKDL